MKDPTRTSGIGRASRIAATVIVAAALLSGLADVAAGRGGSATQTSAAARLSIESVSPWVEADGVFQVRFAPAPGVPADARLTVTIHQSLSPAGDDTVREQLLDIIDGGDPGRILQVPFTTAVAELGDVASGTVLNIPVRSTRAANERVLLPNPGIHPVRLELLGPDTDTGPGTGTEELWSETVFLNRLPVGDAADRRDPVQVSLVLPVDAPPSIAPDGSVELSVEDRASLGAAGSLLADVPGAPMLVAARPNVLDGLEASGEPWATTLLAALSDGSATELALLPYVHLDVAGLLAGGGRSVLDRQLLVGAARTIEHTGRAPVGRTWVLDDTLDTSSLRAVEQTGFSTVLLPLSAVDGTTEDDETLVTRPFRLQGSELSALAFDPEITRLLIDPGASPSSRAHRSVSVLMANWFGATEDDIAATAVLVAPTTQSATLEALTAAVDGGGPLRTDPARSLPRVDEPTVLLDERTRADMGSAVRSAATTSRRLASYRSMAADADPQMSLWQTLNDESVASSLDPAERTVLHETVDVGIAARLSAIELPRPRRVVLTSDDTTVPLRFRNDLGFEVRLQLEARSARLDLDGAALTEIVLAPGENRVDLPVTVQAPGETLLRLRVSTPDDGLLVGAVEVPVRSTGISGVGAALSIVSIVFLLLWWTHTHRRRRRQATETRGVDTSEDISETPLTGPADTGPDGAPDDVTVTSSVDRRG